VRCFTLVLIGIAVVLFGAAGAGLEKRPRLAEAQSAGSERRRARPAEAQSAGSERRRVIAPPGVKPIGPYSPGILTGDFVHVSGQGGRDAGGTLPGTVEGQARQTLQNVKAIVEAAGLTMEHVVYSQVYLDDMAHYDAMDRV